MPGPELVTTPDGTILDRPRRGARTSTASSRGSAGTIRRNFGDGSILNANAAFGLYHLDVDEISLRSGPGQPDRDRILHEQEREYNYELGGDYEFGLGGGRLKLIGLRRFEHSPYRQTLTQTFADGRPTLGQRFTQVADETETIAARRISLARRRRRLAGQRSRARSTGSTSRTACSTLDPLGDFRRRCPSPTAPRRSRSGAPRRC